MYEKFEFSEHELEEFGEEWEGAREDDGGQPGATVSILAGSLK